MVKLRLRRAGLPIAVSAVVAAVAVAGTIIANGTAGAETDRLSRLTRCRDPAGRAGAASSPCRDRRRETRAALAATNERAFGDLTGDGKADLAAIDSSGTMRVYRESSTAGTAPAPGRQSVFNRPDPGRPGLGQVHQPGPARRRQR